MSEASGGPAPQRISFVVPAFDEERRIGDGLQRLTEFCAKQSYESEIVVVDDGSSDGTVALAEEASEHLPERVSLRILKHQHNRGKGAAVRTGMLAATGDPMLYLDVDMATPPDEAPKLLEALAAGADLAIGVRIQPGGYDMRASEPAYRRIGGQIFTAVRRRILLSDVHDTQCGFKAFRRHAAGRIFRLQELDGWSFDAELLYLAQRLGYSIAQLPVEWHHVEGSRFQISASSATRELRDLVRIRWVHRDVGKET
jgi:dolichyl-phosphate beta-glucosyltransferase